MIEHECRASPQGLAQLFLEGGQFYHFETPAVVATHGASKEGVGYGKAGTHKAGLQRRPTFCLRWSHAVAKVTNLGFAI